MTIVHLARHGETIWHEGDRYAGRSDVALTDRGRDQARALGRWASARPISTVASSDLSRARESARPCAEQLGHAIVVDARLREADYGAAEGLTSAEIRARWPLAWASFEAVPASNPLPGGEPGRAVVERVCAAISDLTVQAASGELLVVAHNTALRLWLCHTLGIPIDAYRRSFPRLENCAVVTGSLDGARFRLLSS